MGAYASPSRPTVRASPPNAVSAASKNPQPGRRSSSLPKKYSTARSPAVHKRGTMRSPKGHTPKTRVPSMGKSAASGPKSVEALYVPSATMLPRRILSICKRVYFSSCVNCE